MIFLFPDQVLIFMLYQHILLQGAQIALASPGFIYEPYEPREKIPFWKRLDHNGFVSPWI